MTACCTVFNKGKKLQLPYRQPGGCLASFRAATRTLACLLTLISVPAPVVIFSCLSTVLVAADEPVVARQLYSRAAAALTAKNIGQASIELAQLVERYPMDDLAPLAALRLAECQFAQGNSAKSIELLTQWLPRLSTSTYTQMLEPLAELKAECLLARAYYMSEQWDKVLALARASARRVAAQPASHPPAAQSEQLLLGQLKQITAQAAQRRQQSQAAVLRTAAEQLREKQYEAASQTLESIEPDDLGQAWLWRYRVLRAQCALGRGEPKPALVELDLIQLAELDEAERTAVRMVCLDAALAAQQLTRAQEEVDALAPAAGKDDHLGPTIALRAVELAMLRKDRETADRLARTAKVAFPKFTSAHEFDLLLARNALAKVQFQEARHILEAVISSPPAGDPTAMPRAQWLLGESYFLSRDAALAIDAYTHVIESQNASTWKETALLQRGKCYELLGNPTAATADYRQLLDEFHNSAICLAAQSRLQELEVAMRTARLPAP